jgi:hypothetical protein
MRRTLLIALAATGVALAAAPGGGVWAAEPERAPGAGAAPPLLGEQFFRDLQDAERLMRESMVKMLDSVETLLQAVPRYEAPIVNENGDIIIRRKRPNPGRGPTLRTSAENGMI